MRASSASDYWELYPAAKALALELIEHRCDFTAIQDEIQRILDLPIPSFGAIARLARREGPSPQPSPKGRGGKAKSPLPEGEGKEEEQEDPHPNPLPEGEGGVRATIVSKGAARCHENDSNGEKTILIVPRDARYGLDPTASASSGISPVRHSTFAPFPTTRRLMAIGPDLPEKFQQRLNRDDVGLSCQCEGVTRLSAIACLARQVGGPFEHTIKAGALGARARDSEMIAPSLRACRGCPLFLSRKENAAVRAALHKAQCREARAAR